MSKRGAEKKGLNARFLKKNNGWYLFFSAPRDID